MQYVNRLRFTTLAPWQRAWRKGIAPQLSTPGLTALAKALREDDLRLLKHGAVIRPWPRGGRRNYYKQVVAADVIGFCAWKGDGLETVGELLDFIEEVCRVRGNAVTMPESTVFHDWSARTGRQLWRRLLLAEVELTLARRAAPAA